MIILNAQLRGALGAQYRQAKARWSNDLERARVLRWIDLGNGAKPHDERGLTYFA
jgi:hypothetical protein